MASRLLRSKKTVQEDGEGSEQLDLPWGPPLDSCEESLDVTWEELNVNENVAEMAKGQSD
jgi:hypothetical protein